MRCEAMHANHINGQSNITRRLLIYAYQKTFQRGKTIFLDTMLICMPLNCKTYIKRCLITVTDTRSVNRSIEIAGVA